MKHSYLITMLFIVLTIGGVNSQSFGLGSQDTIDYEINQYNVSVNDTYVPYVGAHSDIEFGFNDFIFGQDLGRKISLYPTSDDGYGFGIQGSLLQIFSDTSVTRVGIGHGTSSSFNEVLSVKGDKVGINNINPGETLDINGNLSASNICYSDGTNCTGTNYTNISQNFLLLDASNDPITGELQIGDSGFDNHGINRAPSSSRRLITNYSTSAVNTAYYDEYNKFTSDGDLDEGDVKTTYGDFLDLNIKSDTLVDTFELPSSDSAYGDYLDMDVTSAYDEDSMSYHDFYGSYKSLNFAGTSTYLDMLDFTGTYNILSGNLGTDAATGTSKTGYHAIISGTTDNSYGYRGSVIGGTNNYFIWASSGDVVLDNDNQDIMLGESQSDFNINFDGTNAYFDVNNLSSIFYFDGNVSVENIIDRSVYWDSYYGDALDNFVSSDTISNNDTNLNSFDRITYQVVDKDNYQIEEEVLYYCYVYVLDENNQSICRDTPYNESLYSLDYSFYNISKSNIVYDKTLVDGRLISASVGKFEEAFVELRSGLDVVEFDNLTNVSTPAIEINHAIVNDLSMASKGYKPTKEDKEIVKDLKKTHYDNDGNLNYSSYGDLWKKTKVKKHIKNDDGSVLEYYEDKDIIDLLEYIGKLETTQKIITDELCLSNKNKYSWCEV